MWGTKKKKKKKKSDQNLIAYGVPKGYILVLLLFTVFINGFDNAIEFSTVHHFAENANIKCQ